MSNVRYPAVVFFTMAIVSIALPIFYYSNLPAQVASHFNFKNQADGWMKKETFLIVQISVNIFLSGMFFAICYFLPKLPNSIINLPNKEFWLSEERREDSINLFQRFMCWMGSLTLGLLSLIFQEVYSTNLAGGNKISSYIWIYMIIFLSAITFMTIKLIFHFNKIDKSN